MGARLMDPGAGVRETGVNRRLAQTDTPVRFCYHSDCTLETVIENGVKGVRRTCDYCPSTVMTPSGQRSLGMPPRSYRVE